MKGAVRFDSMEQLRIWAKRKDLQPRVPHGRSALRRYPTEEEEQIALVDWARSSSLRCPELSLLMHYPAGGYRHPGEARKFARMGVLAGIADLILPVARHGAHALYLEMKALDGTPSLLQLETAARLVRTGNMYVFAFGYEMGRNILEWYLGGHAPRKEHA